MRFVQTVVTDEQAILTHQALLRFLNVPKGDISEDEEEESNVRAMLSGLVNLWSNVIDHPLHFAPTGKMATKVRRVVRKVKGEAQPKPKPKRKRTQARRMSFQKRTRAQKREDAEKWNEAVAKYEAEQQEMEEMRVEQEKRVHELLTAETLDRAQLYELLASTGGGELVKLSKHLLEHQAEETEPDHLEGNYAANVAAVEDDPALD